MKNESPALNIFEFRRAAKRFDEMSFVIFLHDLLVYPRARQNDREGTRKFQASQPVNVPERHLKRYFLARSKGNMRYRRIIYQRTANGRKRFPLSQEWIFLYFCIMAPDNRLVAFVSRLRNHLYADASLLRTRRVEKERINTQGKLRHRLVAEGIFWQPEKTTPLLGKASGIWKVLTHCAALNSSLLFNIFQTCFSSGTPL